MTGMVGSMSVSAFEHSKQNGSSGQVRAEKSKSRDLSSLQTPPGPGIAVPKGEEVSMPETDNLVSSAASFEALHAENVELRERIAQLESRLEESNKQVKDRRTAEDQEFAGLEEKPKSSANHLKIQDSDQLGSARATTTADALAAPKCRRKTTCRLERRTGTRASSPAGR